MSISDLPLINACLNFTSFTLLCFGYLHIKRGNQAMHRNCMIAAFCASTLFLVGYLYYHSQVGDTKFLEPQWFRPFYLALLASHVILAIVIVPLVVITLVLAWRQKFEKHRKIARWTWPIWVYVSVTGVLIYLLLYQIFPQPRA